METNNAEKEFSKKLMDAEYEKGINQYVSIENKNQIITQEPCKYITHTPVVCKYIKHTLLCPKCNTQMHPTGDMLCSYPAQYPHVCPECGYEIRYGLKEKYPYIETIYDEIK